MEKGYTLTELVITIAIIGACAAVAVPGFQNSMNKGKANQAIAYLRTIRTGEKMYYAKNGNYVSCADKAAIASNLGAEVSTENYTFSVLAPTATTFVAKAVKVGVLASNNCNTADTLCLDQDGNWTGTSAYLPAS